MFSKLKKRIALLRGGNKHYFENSLKTGDFILKNIPEHFEVLDILIDSSGVWHFKGLPKKPDQILPKVDLVFNALHGGDGEGGVIQNLIKFYGVKQTHPHIHNSIISLNKYHSKNVFRNFNIKTPYYSFINKSDVNRSKIYELFNSIPHPVVVKPSMGAMGRGVSLVYRIDQFGDALDYAFRYGDSAIIEEYIDGREVSVGIIENFRDKDIYVLPPVEIRKDNNSLYKPHYYDFDYSIHSLTNLEKEEAIKNAILVFKALGLSNYANTNMIINPKRGVFVLEADSQPEIYENTPFNHSMESVSIKSREFLENILLNSL